MLDYKKIYELIYTDGTIHSYKQAIELLEESEIGLDEAIRFLFLRDAYFRLKEKEKAIEYGRLAYNHATKFFEEQEVDDYTILCNQCDTIVNELSKRENSRVIFSCCVSETDTVFSIELINKDHEVKDILIEGFNEMLDEKYGNKTREERYFYYEAVTKKFVLGLKRIFQMTYMIN